jgi:hypothetical protein
VTHATAHRDNAQSLLAALPTEEPAPVVPIRPKRALASARDVIAHALLFTAVGIGTRDFTLHLVRFGDDFRARRAAMAHHPSARRHLTPVQADSSTEGRLSTYGRACSQIDRIAPEATGMEGIR